MLSGLTPFPELISYGVTEIIGHFQQQIWEILTSKWKRNIVYVYYRTIGTELSTVLTKESN